MSLFLFTFGMAKPTDFQILLVVIKKDIKNIFFVFFVEYFCLYNLMSNDEDKSAADSLTRCTWFRIIVGAKAIPP